MQLRYAPTLAHEAKRWQKCYFSKAWATYGVQLRCAPTLANEANVGKSAISPRHGPRTACRHEVPWPLLERPHTRQPAPNITSIFRPIQSVWTTLDCNNTWSDFYRVTPLITETSTSWNRKCGPKTKYKGEKGAKGTKGGKRGSKAVAPPVPPYIKVLRWLTPHTGWSAQASSGVDANLFCRYCVAVHAVQTRGWLACACNVA